MEYGGVEVLTVHFQTPDYLERLLKSAHKYYPGIGIIIVDGSSHRRYGEEARRIAVSYKNTRFCQLGYNIGHGIGLVHGSRHVTTPYVYTMDSDDYFICGGLFDAIVPMMGSGVYGVGDVQNAKRNMVLGDVNDRPMQYLHPSGMLLNLSEFTKYKLPIEHGAPMISVMQDMQDRGLDKTALVNFPPLFNYMVRYRKGTTTRYPELRDDSFRAQTAKDGPCEVFLGA